MLTIKKITQDPETPLYINDSPFGFGAFATRGIKKGEYIYTFEGIPVSFEQSVAFGKDECYSLQIGKREYIHLDAPGKYINHSCDPNCGVTPELELIALKNIEPGEQLFFDYSTTMLERHWTMPCKCGSYNCRGIIKDFDFLPGALQQHYIKLGVVQTFILECLKTSGKK
jgi:hypothetical protein